MTELETLQARVEQLAHDLAESRKAEMDAVMALADIREACGDNGRRMLPGLVAYVRESHAIASQARKNRSDLIEAHMIYSEE